MNQIYLTFLIYDTNKLLSPFLQKMCSRCLGRCLCLVGWRGRSCCKFKTSNTTVNLKKFCIEYVTLCIEYVTFLLLHFWPNLMSCVSFMLQVFDATNTVATRRRFIFEYCTLKNSYKTFFVESICDDPKIIEANIMVCIVAELSLICDYNYKIMVPYELLHK